jgi:ketosteroid isomerase-like protein
MDAAGFERRPPRVVMRALSRRALRRGWISDTGPAMSRKNVAAAKRIYESRNRGDVDGVLAECHPDVEWHPHLATLSRQSIRGPQGVREYMASLQEDWESFRHEPEQFFDAGDKVVVFLHTYARGRASGVDVEVPVAHVLTFERGKCLGFVSYHDRAEALKVAGLKE